MNRSFKDWLSEGENMYGSLLEELDNFERQIAELQQHLGAKKAEVNELAGVIGKPKVDGHRRLADELDQLSQPSGPNIGARAEPGSVAVKLL